MKATDIRVFGIEFRFGRIEYYFLVLDRYTEGDIERSEFGIQSLIAVICLVTPAFQLKSFSVGLWLVIPLPFSYALFRVI